MENRADIRKSILNESSYWIEKLNIDLYDALIIYQEKNHLSKGELASYLGISKGRLSQILNSGNSNFNTSTLVAILLKLGKYPHIEFIDQATFLEKEEASKNSFARMQITVTNNFVSANLAVGRPKMVRLGNTQIEMDKTTSIHAFSHVRKAQ